MDEVIYTTSATAKGAATVHVKSDDGLVTMEMRAPKEMGGPGGEYTNPEQIFAIGYASCFLSAINYVAFSKKIKAESSVTARVKTKNNGQGGFIFGVDLEVTVNGLEQKEAEELVENATKVCPYSNSTHGSIEVTIHTTVQ